MRLSSLLHAAHARLQTPLIARSVLAVLLLASLFPILRLGLSSDDVGIAWRHDTASNGLFSPELWLDPHHNRFPLNTIFAYWLHGPTLENPGLAHFAMWVVIAASAIALYASIALVGRWARRSDDPNARPADESWPLAGAVIVFTGWPLLLSWIDLSCSHYLLCLLFFFAALQVRARRHGYVLSAALVGLGMLCSEMGVFLAAQFVLLDCARAGGKPWSKERLGWLALAATPFAAAKAAIFLGGGVEALFWKAYPPKPTDLPKDVLRGLRYVFLPFKAIPIAAIGVAYAALIAWAIKTRASTPLSPARRARLRLFAVALPLSLVPFVFFNFDYVTPRLFTEAVVIAALWAPFVARDLGLARAPLAALAALMSFNQILFFANSLAAENRSARVFESFRRQATASRLADGRFAKNMAVFYRVQDPTQLAADWGLRLLFEEPHLRDRLLGWAPLKSDQRVAVFYGPETRACLPEKLDPGATEALVFSDEPAPPERVSLCGPAPACADCREVVPTTTLRAPVRASL